MATVRTFKSRGHDVIWLDLEDISEPVAFW